MIDEINKLLNDYQVWLRDKTSLRQIGDWVEISTPFIDRHNDSLLLYVKKEPNGFVITDDGYTLDDLQVSGCSLDSPKRQALLKMTLNGFGVEYNDSRLEVHTSSDNFALRKHSLIQAMLAINDLFFLAAPVVANLFYEDVIAWLDLHEIRYTPNIKFTGKSGYDYVFDFVIPKSRIYPERIIKAITNPTKDAAQALVFSWIDTREVRPPDSSAYAFLNDSEHEVSPTITSAIERYAIHPIVWSMRDMAQKELAG